MSILTNTRSKIAGRRSVSRVLAPLPLGLLLAACGQRYELGEVLKALDTEHPTAADAVSQVVIDELRDIDVQLPDDAVALWSSRGVGDVDGDGRGDWVASARARLDRLDRNDQRIVYGAPRPASGVLESNLGPIVSEPGTTASRAPAAAGDVDGDGHADILWSSFDSVELSPGADPVAYFESSHLRQHEQRAYLSYGGPRGELDELFLPDAGVTFDPIPAVRDALRTELLGVADAQANGYMAMQSIDLASVGDLDADGFADFTVTYSFRWSGVVDPGTSPITFTDAGERSAAVTYLFYGGAERLAGDAWALRNAELPHVKQVSPVGDMDGDGYPEFAAQLEGGQTYLLSGSAARLTGTVPVLQQGVRLAVAEEGSTVEAVGDMDGDSYADLVVIGSWGDGSATASLFYGGPQRLDDPFVADYADAAFVLADGMLGVMSIGDWNGDGKADLMAALGRVDARAYTPPRFAASLIPGTTERYSGVYVTPLADPARYSDTQDLIGALAVTPLGDIDGDGLADVQLTTERVAGIKYGGALGSPIQ